MIAKLSGLIDELKPSELILDVSGVGYHLFIPFSTFEKLHGGTNVQLFVHTIHRDDQFKLYGFISENEKTLFSILLGISGIGPAMALSILSGIKPETLINAIRDEDSGVLTKIPGVGKTKAEKLIFELKRKIKKFEYMSEAFPGTSSTRNDAIEALASLGFDESKASRAVDEILDKSPDSPIENLVKESLKNISS